VTNGELVLVISTAVAGVNAAVWIPIVRRLRAMAARIARDLANERVARGPERANYSGASAEYSKVRGTGKLALTDRRLVFYKVFGAPIEIARADIASATTARSFKSERHVGRTHLVVKTTRGIELGFIVADPAAWIGALGLSNPAT